MNELKTVAWTWRDHSGRFLEPAAMETRHLFYTLRMIWNHTLPESVRLHPYRRYRFSPFYTIEYLQQAIYYIGQE